MPSPVGIFPGNEDEGINFRLWIGILLPPFAAGLNTLVGYMVSNYDCNVHNRHLVLFINIVSAILCLVAAGIASSAKRKFEVDTDAQSPSLLHTRRFMLRLGLWFSAGFLVVILAGTTSTFILRPCDL
jgi:hypothetical protein